VAGLLPFQAAMYAQQTQVLPPHTYQSSWWSWPLMIRPICSTHWILVKNSQMKNSMMILEKRTKKKKKTGIICDVIYYLGIFIGK